MVMFYLNFCGTVSINAINTPLYRLAFLYNFGANLSCMKFGWGTLKLETYGKVNGLVFLITDADLYQVISTDMPYTVEILNSI